MNVVRMHDGSGMTARGGVPAGAMMTKRSRTGGVPRATDHDPPPQRGVIGEYTREEGGMEPLWKNFVSWYHPLARVVRFT